MKLEEMLLERASHEEKVKTLEEELASLKAAAVVLKKKMDDAAEAGDVEAYSVARKENEKNEDTIFVKDKALEKIKGEKKIYSKEDVVAAWDVHIETYNKRFSKKIFELEKTIETLYQQYEKMLADQTEMMKLRRQCIDLFDGKLSLGLGDRMYSDTFKAEMIPKLHCRDMVVYNGYRFVDVLTPLLLDFGKLSQDDALKNARIIDGIFATK